MTTSGPTRWGIVGAGQIANDFVKALRTLDSAEHKVVAVADRHLEAAQKFCKEHNNIPHAYGSCREIAQDPDIDVFYVATIHPTHAEMCKTLIEHDRNILCEKPFTMNLREAKQVHELAKERDVFIMEGLWSRFFPAYSQLCSLLDDGVIGDIRFVNVTCGYDVLSIPRCFDKSLGGGCFLDQGIYAVQFVLLVFRDEKPEKIVSTGGLTSTGVDTFETVTLHYSGGRSAQITAHAACTMRKDAFVYGGNGYIHVPEFRTPEKLHHYGLDKTGWEHELLQSYEFPLPRRPAGMVYPATEAFTYQIKAVRQALLKGEKCCPEVRPEDTFSVHTVLDTVRRQLGVVYDADEIVV